MWFPNEEGTSLSLSLFSHGVCVCVHWCHSYEKPPTNADLPVTCVLLTSLLIYPAAERFASAAAPGRARVPHWTF